MIKTIKGKLDATDTVVVANVATAVNITTDNITAPAHELKTGQIVDVITGTTIPTGLAVTTVYYVIAVDKDTLALAATLAGAQAGTKVNLTATGAGTLTLRVNAFGASIPCSTEAIPNGATILDCWTLSTTTFVTSGTGTSALALNVGGAVLNASSATAGGDYTALDRHILDSAAIVQTSSAGKITATIITASVTDGAMDIYVTYAI